MSGPSGNQLVLLSLESWFFQHQDSRENKNCFSRYLTLSVYYYISLTIEYELIQRLNWIKTYFNIKTKPSNPEQEGTKVPQRH